MIKKIRQWISDSLGFSRTEANGTLILIVLILIFVIFPKLIFIKNNSVNPTSDTDKEILENWFREFEMALAETRINQTVKERTDQKVTRPFKFNPNTTTRSELEMLGFSDRTVKNIISYRDNGGNFSVKSDLNKIYGIDKKLLEALSPFIDLPVEKYITYSPKEKASKPLTIDLNYATAEVFQHIRGIGPTLSTRIVRFRDKLGGFHSADQLYEVYGLDSAVVSRLITSSTISNEVNKVNINTDSVKQLYTHPYIDYKTANVIINYRQQHGNFDSVVQIKEIKIISDSLYQKIYPYLSVRP